MRRILAVLAVLACAPCAQAKLADTQWKDAETRWHLLFASPGQTDDKAAVLKLVGGDGEPRSFTLVADGIALESGHCGRIAEKKATSLTDLQKYLGKKDNDWRPGEELEMLRLQGEVGALERQLVDEEKVLKSLIAASTAGSEAFRKVVLARCMGQKDWAIRAAGARVAGSMPEEPASHAMLQASLDKEVDARVRRAALEALSTAPGTAWHADVIGRLQDPDWTVQLLAARIAGARTIGKAIPELIVALAKCTPRVAEEVNASLKKLTGQNFDAFAEVWSKWWADNRAKFGSDGKPLEPFLASGTRGEDATFYGIKVKSDRVVFVIDISGSMKEEKKAPASKSGPTTGDAPAPVAALSGTKIEIAKVHLKRAIEKLPKQAMFNIIAFNHSVTQWDPKMVQATPENKEKAYAFIRDFPPKGSTFIDGALRMAFKLAGIGAYDKNYAPSVDTIFLLSDGAPTDNGFPQSKNMEPSEILGHVKEWNPTKSVIINCVGIDNVVTGIKFLKDLAADNGGTYVDG